MGLQPTVCLHWCYYDFVSHEDSAITQKEQETQEVN